jgi:exopolyphosphatase / guanosine-5'-triphosphate,3'-diphosphate pyrophosphatase
LKLRRRGTAEAVIRIPDVRVAVVDVGANTLRLLVADCAGDGGLVPVREERVQLGLGEEIERDGVLSRQKLRSVRETAERLLRRARKLGADQVEVLVTSPGRQSGNAQDLIAALHDAGAGDVRVLSAEEEARLAWVGAVEAASGLPEVVAVCDVGGGSTQIVVGSVSGGPSWARSFDVGSLRLTHRLLEADPPAPASVAAARVTAASELAAGAGPMPQAALATGGTARALRRVVGRTLDHQSLETAVLTLACCTRRQIVKAYGVDPPRARTLLAGSIILSEAQRRLGVPLVVARGGLREGAALTLAETAAVASA